VSRKQLPQKFDENLQKWLVSSESFTNISTLFNTCWTFVSYVVE